MADPFQRYRGLEIAADSPRADELARVPHHGVADLALTEASTAASFAGLAHAAIDAALEAGRVPIVTGGTGLYLRAGLADLRFPIRPTRSCATGPSGWRASTPRRRSRSCAPGTPSVPTASTPPTRGGSPAPWSWPRPGRPAPATTCGPPPTATPRSWWA